MMKTKLVLVMLLACAFGAPAWAEEGILNKAKKEVGEALVGKEETKAEAQKVNKGNK